MATQNIYDDPKFFAGYRNLRDNLVALHENVVQPMLPAILPDLDGKRIVDLGCGEGFFCREARAQGALHVIGIDPSERMLELARQRTADPEIEYDQSFAEDAVVAPESMDVVVSILALHYVADHERVLQAVARWLVAGGIFVLIIEHPVATAQDPWVGYTLDGDVETAWMLNHYFDEGKREQEWYIPGVVKYHRKTDTTVNALIKAGFELEYLSEPAPSKEAVEEHPRSRGDLIRPGLLGVRARKRLS